MNPGLTLGSCGKHRHIDGGNREIRLTIKTRESPEQCFEQGDGKRIDGADGKREAERFENQSNYRMKAAEELLEGDASSIAIVEG